jgi:phage protein D
MDGAAPAIAVDWSPGGKPQDLTPAVTSLSVDDHDRLIDEARITLGDGFALAAAHFEPGQRVTVRIGWERKLTKVFEGAIDRVEGASGSHATLVVHDPAAPMNRGKQGRAFPPNLSLGFLVREVASKYEVPIADISCDPDPTFAGHNTPHQVDLTDWEFLQGLARVWGARCFVEVNDDKASFYFKSVRALWAASPLATLTHCRGWGNVMSFRYERVAAKAARQLATVAFDPKTGQPVRGQGDAPPAPPPATGSLSPDLAAHEPGLAQVHQQATAATAASPPPVPSPPLHLLGLPADPDRAAALAVTDPTQVSGYRAEATVVGNTGLRAKGRVKVEGIAPWAEGDWWVKRATHCWERARTATDQPTATYVTKLELTR